MRAVVSRRRALVRALVLAVTVGSAVLALAPSAFASSPTTLGVSGWQVYSDTNIYANPNPGGGHGNQGEYGAAPAVPGQGDSGWANCGPSAPLRSSPYTGSPISLCPNPTTIGMGVGSILSDCMAHLNFTFFQAFVSIPTGTTISNFEVGLGGADDGARATIYNSLYPSGYTFPGIVLGGGAGSTDLSSYAAAGEVNRIVITQVDDCAVGNNLNSAQISLGGTVIPAKPTLNLPADITTPATSLAGAPVSYSVSATDAYDGTTSVSCTPPSGSTFPIGTTTVNCTAGPDSQNQTSSGSFNVTVTDTSCQPGTYSATGVAPCTAAPPGTYVDSVGATSATPCPAGSFSATAGSAECTLAPAGTYVATAGAASATPCAPGTYSSSTGSTQCALAPAGSYVEGPGATSATPCPAGSYSAYAGSVVCTLAPAGSYVSGAGATSPTPCPAGSYSATAGSAECTLAPAGTYVSGAGATSATPCPAGSYSATAGSTVCVLAPAGSYVGSAGQTSATPCPAGSYSATAGSTVCVLAPAGSYVGAAGQTSATPCPAGSYSATTGSTECTLAPAGSYVSTAGAASATPCAPGSYSSSAGSTACTPAPVDTYVDTVGATEPTPCSPGTTTNGLIGQTACIVDAASLCALVEQYVSNHGIANSLCVKINAAATAGARGQMKTKANNLAAFDNEVAAQSGKALTADQASVLVGLAARL